MRLDNSNIRRELPLDSLHEEEIRYLIDIVLFVTYALVGASHMGFLLFNHHQTMIVLDSLSGALICSLLDWMLAQIRTRKIVKYRLKFIYIFCFWAALKNSFEYHLIIASLELFTLYELRKRVSLNQTIKIIEFYCFTIWLLVFLYSVNKQLYTLTLGCQLAKTGLVAAQWTVLTFYNGQLPLSMESLLKHQKMQANLFVGFLLLIFQDLSVLVGIDKKASLILFALYELYFVGALVFLVLFKREIIRMRAFRSLQTVYYRGSHEIVYPINAQSYIGHMNINMISKINKNDFTMDSCVKCFKNPSEILFVMCNHVCLCRKCALQMDSKNMMKCPLCNIRSIRHLRLQMEPYEKFSEWKYGIQIRGLLEGNQYILKTVDYIH